MSKFIVSGGSQEESLEFKKSEINHLRLMLAWMRCEYMLDENMQQGYVEGVLCCVENDFTSKEMGKELLEKKANEIRKIPKYVRQAVKMLTKMINEHEKRLNIIDVKPEKEDESVLRIEK